MRVRKGTKQTVFAAFVVVEAIVFGLHVTRLEPAHLLAPISIIALIAYTAFLIITWSK